MTIEFLDQWIAALRSGAFTQIKGSLRIVREGVGECFCALGVGVEMWMKTEPNIKKLPRLGYQYGFLDFNANPVIAEGSGFIESLEDYRMMQDVVKLNDGAEMSFKEIAIYLDTVVRKQLLDREARHGEKTKETGCED